MALQHSTPVAAQQQFSDFLLSIGDGREPVETDIGDDMIKLPGAMCVDGEDPAGLLDKVFGTDAAIFDQPSFMVGRGILTTKNADVDDFNAKALQRFPGQVCLHDRKFFWPMPIQR